MLLSYRVTNASLTQRLLTMLQNMLGSKLLCTTVIFFNDFWIIRIVLSPKTTSVDRNNCRAILQENGSLHTSNIWTHSVFQALDRGDTLLEVMNCYKIVILFHGASKPEEITLFQQNFISGLGYCPPSLV